MRSVTDIHELGFHPAHLEAKLFSLFTVYAQSVSQLAVRRAEQDGVVSVLQVSQMVTAKGHSGDPLTNLGHQMVNDAIEEVRSSHAALANATRDGKPV